MFRILTKGLIIRNNDEFLLLKRREGSFAGGQWDIPGGKLEFGEALEESLLREIYEETRLKVKVNKVISISSGINNEQKRQYITLVYLCPYQSGDVILNEEHTDYKWVRVNSIEEEKTVYYVKEAIKRYVQDV
jgi:mutator protein MutT